MNPEIERLQRVIANAVKLRKKYRERVENPINQKTGRPLSPKTVNTYQTKVNQFTRQITLCEREIQEIMATNNRR